VKCSRALAVLHKLKGNLEADSINFIARPIIKFSVAKTKLSFVHSMKTLSCHTRVHGAGWKPRSPMAASVL
jgi:hypothetical protein